MVTYIFEVTINIDRVVPEIKSLFDTINNIIKSTGDHGQYVWRGKAIEVKIQSERELKSDEMNKLKDAVIKSFTETQPEWNASIENVRMLIND